MRPRDDKTPVVLLTKIILPKNGDEGVAAGFWCPFCARSHTHGIGLATEWGSPEWIRAHGTFGYELMERRAAHCVDPDSPFKKTGYYILLQRKFYDSVVTPAVIERLRQNRHSQGRGRTEHYLQDHDRTQHTTR